MTLVVVVGADGLISRFDRYGSSCYYYKTNNKLSYFGYKYKLFKIQ